MSSDWHWKPVGGKKTGSVFEPVDWSSSSANSFSNSNSWGYSSNENSNNWGHSPKESSWAYQSGNPNSNTGSQQNSWAYQTGSSNGGHWGHQQGYGFGDKHGFGNDSSLWDLESQQRQSSWGRCDGSSWHFSNANRDLDLYHGIESARRVNESNSLFAKSSGFETSKSHYSTVSSFNPFSKNKV